MNGQALRALLVIGVGPLWVIACLLNRPWPRKWLRRLLRTVTRAVGPLWPSLRPREPGPADIARHPAVRSKQPERAIGVQAGHFEPDGKPLTEREERALAQVEWDTDFIRVPEPRYRRARRQS